MKKYTFNPLILFMTAGSKLAHNKTPTNGKANPACAWFITLSKDTSWILKSCSASSLAVAKQAQTIE
ncbi:hypothetical protein, partial [Vibrio parahaemolyticus]|uniref:hypothetical protein n=1 Tax=Vibrio parahaemolyticus TaxID=670 RepID=UPI001D157E44